MSTIFATDGATNYALDVQSRISTASGTAGEYYPSASGWWYRWPEPYIYPPVTEHHYYHWPTIVSDINLKAINDGLAEYDVKLYALENDEGYIVTGGDKVLGHFKRFEQAFKAAMKRVSGD